MRLCATRTGRDRSAVRTGARVAEEGTYLLGGFGRKDVFELACLLLNLALVLHAEALGEEALGETVTTNNASGALTSARSEFNDHAAVGRKFPGGLERVMTGIFDGAMFVGIGAMGDEIDESALSHALRSE